MVRSLQDAGPRARGSCRRIADKIDVYKVNVEAEEELSALFGIRSVPTLLFIPMDGTPQMAQGALPKVALKDAIWNVLLGE